MQEDMTMLEMKNIYYAYKSKINAGGYDNA